MVSLYINILKYLLEDKSNYIKYKEYIDYKYIKEYFPELYKLYITLDNIYSNTEELKVSNDLLQIHFSRLYPASSSSEYTSLFETLSTKLEEASERGIEGLLEEAARRKSASTLIDLGVAYVESGLGQEKLNEACRKLISDFESSGVGVLPTESLFVDMQCINLEEAKKEPGLRWSLDSLNKSLGSLRKGDFGFIVARPETGKTTFLASEVGFFSTQLGEEEVILWVNNEERASKVALRIKQSLSSRGSLSNVLIEGGIQKIRLPKDLILQKKEVERLCETIKPRLIVIDQLDKIKGFEGDRYDLELKAAYAWARELAARYGPVVGVCQAGASAENKKWVGMGDVDSSKTGKQGEADWILGIGRTDNEDANLVRYFYLSKNKLLGDSDTDPSRRHDKWTVKILPDEAIYEDF